MSLPSLLGLPTELRLEIYTHLFTSPYSTTLTTPTLHPLLRTSRLLRQEALPVFLSLTNFNAHLDDGPPTPLARWLVTLGKQKCLWLRQVRVWDMHMLNTELYGVEETEKILRESDGKWGGRDGREGVKYVLRKVGSRESLRSFELEVIRVALEGIGVGLARFCVVGGGYGGGETSRFAMVPLSGNDGGCGLRLVNSMLDDPHATTI